MREPLTVYRLPKTARWVVGNGLLCLLLVLPGCIVQSRIQGKYIAQQDTCRDQAQSTVSADSTAPKQVQNDQIVSQFSDCMNKAGWHVAVPKPAGTLPTSTAQNPPTGIFPSTPPALSAARVAPQATPAYSGATPSAFPVVGPGVIPNPAPATAPAAQYQTAPPLTSGAPAVEMPYGAGAGRQF